MLNTNSQRLKNVAMLMPMSMRITETVPIWPKVASIAV